MSTNIAQPTPSNQVNRYRLFAEFRDIALWGSDLADAILRKRTLTPVATRATLERVTERNCTFTRDTTPPLVVSRVLGYRDTSRSTRGSTPYLSAVVELEDLRIIEVHAYQDATLMA